MKIKYREPLESDDVIEISIVVSYSNKLDKYILDLYELDHIDYYPTDSRIKRIIRFNNRWPRSEADIIKYERTTGNLGFSLVHKLENNQIVRIPKKLSILEKIKI